MLAAAFSKPFHDILEIRSGSPCALFLTCPHIPNSFTLTKDTKLCGGGAPSAALTTFATISVFAASFFGTLNLNPDPVLAYVSDISPTQLVTHTTQAFSSFSSGTLASLSPISQLAAAGATDIIGTITDWFGSLFTKNEVTATNAPSTPPVVHTPAATSTPATRPTTAPLPLQSAGTTYITQPVIERTIVQQGSGLSQSSLTEQLTSLKDELLSRIASINLLAPSLPVATFQAFAQSQRIDQLANTDLTNVTVHGVNGLTDADVPDGITAANYLPLAGGILTGALTGTSLTLSGLLTAGSLAVSAISSTGAVEAPYFTATSTTASSTFPNLLSTNSTTTNATSTSLFATLGRFTSSISDSLTATLATISSLTASNLTATNSTTTNATSTNLYTDHLALGTPLAGASGGTGWSTLQANTVLLGNGTGALATTSVGINGQVLALLSGVPTWVATTTLATISGALNSTQLDGVFGSNGILTRTTTGTYVSRTLTGTAGQITLTNGDGVAGNPTLSLPAQLALTNASTSAISANTVAFGQTGTTSISSSGALTIQSLSGFLKATAGLVGTALVNLASDITGILPTANGGTGWAAIQSGFIPYGNGGSALATSSSLSFDGTKLIATYASTTALTSSGSAYFATSGGNVGIGTAAPSAKLHIVGAVNATLFLDRTGSPTANRFGLFVGDGTGGFIADENYLTNSNTSLHIRTGASLATEAMTILNSGNVGIGTTTPTVYKFQVAADGTTGQFAVTGSTNAANQFSMGYDTTGNFGFLQAITQGSAFRNIVLNPSGGNVGIGTTTPATALDINDGAVSTVHGALRIEGTISAVNSGHSIDWYGGGGSQGSVSYARIAGVTDSAGGTGILSFYTSGGLGSLAASEKLRIDGSGNVGIGATSPLQKLAVTGSSAVTDGGSGLTGIFAITTGTGGQLDNKLEFGVHDGDYSWIQAVQAGAAYRNLVLNGSGGNVGIGTTNPDNGKVEVKGGTVCVDTNSDDNASSCIASESDARLKTNVTPLSASTSLATLLALNPVSFDWRATDPEVLKHYPLIGRFASSTHSIGLIAQEVQPLVPEAIEQETVGDAEVQYFQLDYTKMIPLLIKGVQEVATLGTTFKSTLIAWLGDAGNGITAIFAKKVQTAQLCAEKSDGTTFCVTGDQLASVLSGSTSGPISDPTPSAPAPDTEAPVITIAGNNPAQVDIGVTYNDLGATVTDNVDTNLGIHTFVGDTPIDQANIDTSSPATYHINYVATDAAGNTATSTRTVIVQAASSGPSIDEVAATSTEAE